MLPSSWLARWNVLHGAPSAHRFLHELADPCLFSGSQLLQREGDRPQGAFVEVRAVVEAERRVPRLELVRGLEEATTLPSLAYAGIPYQSFGERAGALALIIAWSRSPRARSGACISPIFASTALSPSALSAFSSWTRSLIAPRSSFVNPLIAFAGFFVAFLSTLSSVDMRWSPFGRVGQGKRVFPLSNTR